MTPISTLMNMNRWNFYIAVAAIAIGAIGYIFTYRSNSNSEKGLNQIENPEQAGNFIEEEKPSKGSRGAEIYSGSDWSIYDELHRLKSIGKPGHFAVLKFSELIPAADDESKQQVQIVPDGIIQELASFIREVVRERHLPDELTNLEYYRAYKDVNELSMYGINDPNLKPISPSTDYLVLEFSSPNGDFYIKDNAFSLTVRIDLKTELNVDELNIERVYEVLNEYIKFSSDYSLQGRNIQIDSDSDNIFGRIRSDSYPTFGYSTDKSSEPVAWEDSIIFFIRPNLIYFAVPQLKALNQYGGLTVPNRF